jgi:CheY-like chemotaxis protein
MPASLRGVHVFLVVDNVQSRELLRAALEHAGALVSMPASPGAALAALDAIRPDVLLADVGDTDQQPAALITRVRALPGCAAIPSIVVTADDDHDARRRLLDARYHEHVRRPIDARALCQVVASLAERRR